MKTDRLARTSRGIFQRQSHLVIQLLTQYACKIMAANLLNLYKTEQQTYNDVPGTFVTASRVKDQKKIL
jgi:hypothetical protein